MAVIGLELWAWQLFRGSRFQNKPPILPYHTETAALDRIIPLVAAEYHI